MAQHNFMAQHCYEGSGSCGWLSRLARWTMASCSPKQVSSGFQILIYNPVMFTSPPLQGTLQDALFKARRGEPGPW